MDNKELKLYAGHVVINSKLTKESKFQILEFIKNASPEQIKVFIMDGKMVKLDEQSAQIASDRFDVTVDTVELREFFEYAGSLNAIGEKGLGTINQCKKTKCYKLKGDEKKKCIKLCEIAGHKSMIGGLTAGKSRCKVARKPEKCIARFDSTIKRHQDAIQKKAAK